jgi:chemotaxis response regulator CheB
MTPLRILVVDDHEEIRKAIKALLSAHKRWSICGEAEDGIEGVEKAIKLRPDVIIMDVSMPRMNGDQNPAHGNSEFRRSHSESE